MENPSRPVTGYPVPPAQSTANTNGYAAAQHSCSAAPTGAAYPYPAPPSQYNYYAANMHPYPQYYAPRATFFRRFLAAMIAVFVIIGTIVLIIWLVLRPRLPEFRVDSISATGFNFSVSQVTGKWDVAFTVTNPNKKISISYDNVESLFSYRLTLLAVTAVPPFGQGTRVQTAFNASFAAQSVYVNERDANAMSADRRGGSVSFNVRVLSRVWFKTGAWRPRRRLLRVWCEGLSVGFSSNGGAGKLVGGPRECGVGL
ncbi:NDR1/HIN1-like protein 10 [Malania oleifera]|uniref:NDR1/HIN1-like protein 10 n=1 Tax=Malania oleifera TaxID=397392 RepID=UPI0025AE96D6|nr:NDR1/HIN1-like protein 10 [Malania oleifera]XP_057955297.1 NDR1/HIN1-like protein 10 [Malania oleifera]XP_057955299.1 NDR1/HIN1-like protein 10 [Malania oleifera]XP_057955300.1 NDR1/HIN1-like protein 10 [Malania oleifera]